MGEGGGRWVKEAAWQQWREEATETGTMVEGGCGGWRNWVLEAKDVDLPSSGLEAAWWWREGDGGAVEDGVALVKDETLGYNLYCREREAKLSLADPVSRMFDNGGSMNLLHALKNYLESSSFINKWHLHTKSQILAWIAIKNQSKYLPFYNYPRRLFIFWAT